ncbi:hypothetical protein DRN86_05305 [Candidatus Geothermarchaeota archaeon]|nr:MAG: hypothetical protein DRN86_05305 [Candidatus Geothermarchaeota archaeon]
MCVLFVNALKEGLSSTSYDIVQSRSLKDLKFERIADDVVMYSNLGLRPLKLESGVKNIIFHPLGFSNLMRYAFVEAVNSYNVQEGKSYLSNMRDLQVGSEKLTIIDDGTLNEGILSSPVDAEGVPTMRNVIIEKGILKNYLYDSYTANREGVKSTGNAFRELSGRVEIGPRNEIIIGEEAELEEMMRE